MFKRSGLHYSALLITAILVIIFTLAACGSGRVENYVDNSGISNSAVPDKDYKDYSLTILGTNDIHGCFNTMPQYSTIVNQVRGERENVLLLDAGDIFKRGKYEDYQGKIEMEIANAMGYDAMVLGNNEFKVPGSKKSKKKAGTLLESDTQISNLVKWARFPILCGNVRLNGTNEYIDNVKPYVVEEIGGLRVAIIGITSTSPKDEALEMAVNKDFIPGDEAVRQLLPGVKRVSDIQIVLSHAGISTDKMIKGVSAIIGGHDHISTSKPVVSNGIPIMQAGGGGRHYLGRLDLNFKYKDDKWVLDNFNGRLYSAKGITKDEEIKNIIDGYKGKKD